MEAKTKKYVGGGAGVVILLVLLFFSIKGCSDHKNERDSLLDKMAQDSLNHKGLLKNKADSIVNLKKQLEEAREKFVDKVNELDDTVKSFAKKDTSRIVALANLAHHVVSLQQDSAKRQQAPIQHRKSYSGRRYATRSVTPHYCSCNVP